jgi:hypothetical protein
VSDFFDYTKKIIPATETEFLVSTSGHSVAYTNFIGRTSGLDATHLNAYAGLLDGLTTDGLFNSDGTSSYLDVLHCLATQDSTTALLNLVSSSFNAVLVGTPTFTADQGYSATTNANRLTSYNAKTAGGFYTLNSASMGCWCFNTPTDGCAPLGMTNAATQGEHLIPSLSGSCFMRVNDGPNTGGFVLANSAGFFLGNRDSATTRQGYKNAVSIGSYGVAPSESLLNNDTFSLGYSQNQSSDMASTLSIVVFGGSLNSTLAGNLYSRFNTYMGAV